MPPYQRRRYFYRNWWNSRRKRYWNRRWRPRKTIRYRKRRQRRVRRRFYKKNRKLKRLRINEWQPSSIKKCKIEGYLVLFQAGYGRYSNNYPLWKEVIFPPHYPGGGGWGIQQLSLGNLYTQHKELMNYWTKSNDRMNMCRYMGVTITLFREQHTDWIFSYYDSLPKTVTKYFYTSHHPMLMLTHKRKKTVPSFDSQPHKRKPYKKIFVRPPRLMKNQWYFQQQLADFPLLTFAASACSLQGMFGSINAVNNNATMYCIDHAVFTNPIFQYKTQTHPQWGYRINDTLYLYGLQNGAHVFTENLYRDSIYLGNTMNNQRGAVVNSYKESEFQTKYPFGEWGNPFFWGYMTGNLTLFQNSIDPKTMAKTPTMKLQQTWLRENPYVFKVRYNPFKDKGRGNQVYFIPNYDTSHNTWEPTKDTDIIFENYPLWLLLWGLEDIVKRMGKCKNLDNDWTLVIKSNWIQPPQPYYIPVSYDFVHGRGPYDTERDEMSRDDYTNWYPRFKYQRQAIQNIIMTGPAVARGDYAKNIQAKMKYTFHFKWGGNSEPQESVFDPTNQPITPAPPNIYSINEITNPHASITGEIYPWDFRRDMLTESATERIRQSPTNETYMFTDGDETSTDIKIFTPETQKKTTQKTQKETLLQQLQLIQSYNQQLQLRFRKLKQLSKDP